MATTSTLLLFAAFCALFATYQLVEGTTIVVHNQCSYTVCAKYWVPGISSGACSALSSGGTWTVSATQSWQGATMWAIANTDCSGQACNTGPPSGVTQFEISVNSNGGHDFYDISALAGFNIALKVVPTDGSCTTVDCQGDSASACPSGYYTGGPDETKACDTGTNYDLYLCA